MPEALASRPAVSDLIRAAAARLAAAGCDTPRLDAELLLIAALGHDSRARLVIDAAAPVEPEAEAQFEALVSRRAAREPVAYILARKPFRRITLSVDRRVLVPRPETEVLVEAGLALPRGARVADVGTGSGAVALALKDERPDLEVTGLDVDLDALEVARANAAALGLEVGFRQADLLPDAGAGFEAVLANLPYVPDGERLMPEIARYEPPRALYAGPDGLELIRRLVSTASQVPFLGLEVGAGQASAVRRLLAAAGFDAIETRRDLAGVERVLVARR